MPVRMCVICRCRAPLAELARCVRSADGLVFDVPPRPSGKTGRTGRGWYVCSRPECREKLKRFRLKRRAAKEAADAAR